jgi:hypothetical protein
MMMAKIGRPGQAGAVTPEMIDAGVAILCEHCPDTAADDAVDRAMAEEIYLAMAGLRGAPEARASAS